MKAGCFDQLGERRALGPFQQGNDHNLARSWRVLRLEPCESFRPGVGAAPGCLIVTLRLAARAPGKQP
jgi:hypothetical protein